MRQNEQQAAHPLSRIIILFTLSVSLFSLSVSHAGESFLILPAIHLLLNGNVYEDETCGINYIDNDPKYDLVYEGLYYYQPDMSHTRYGLEQLSDSEFNQLSMTDSRKVADNLLAALFFGYPAQTLENKITSGNFLCSVRKRLSEKNNNMAWVEEEIRSDDHYYHSDWGINEVYDILARF